MNKLLSIILLFILTCNLLTAQNKPEIRSSEGVPELFINGQSCPPFAYMSYLGESEYYKEIAETGIHLYCFPAYLGDRGINARSGIGPFRPALWTGENQFDFSSIEEDFKKIIDSDPKAKVIIRLHLDPPLWWEKLNPDGSCQLPDGTTFRQCFSSQKWQEETGSVIKKFINWLLNSSYSEYLIGIHVAAGSTEEWFYHSQQYNDQNPARREAFRKWLADKYRGDNTSLKRAWGDNLVSFDTALPANINKKPSDRWRDPKQEQKTIDTYMFHAETLADNIKNFCKIIKEESNNTLLAGAFYGYHNYVTDSRMGHGALAKLLQCDDLDFLSSPNVYYRVIGEDWTPMSAIQSVQMHGKLWLAENDTRTSITTLLKEQAPEIAPPGQYESGVWLGPEDMKTSVSFLWKNAGRMLTYGYGGWWFDMWGGWYSDPELLNVIEKTKEYYASFPQDKGEEMQSQVCVIHDEHLCFRDASYGRLTERILSNRYPLGKTGAPYDHFLRSDQEKISTAKYKIIWLMGFPELNEKELKNIRKWKRNGITVMWTDTDRTHIFKRGSDEIVINDVVFLSDSQLRDIFKNAGVHVYLDSGDVFYIGRNWLCIHSVFGGKKTLKFPFYTQIINPENGKKLSDRTNFFELNMESKSTIILRLNPLN